jgi:glucan 1,3-beta-glucosidase
MIKGVNLGNWLVLEKWMSPALFAGTDAEDETHLCTELDEVAKRERLKVHRDSYITERDFLYLATRGIELVRIPVPFFIFEDYGPFVGCISYLDKAFSWAERHKIKVLPELHTVPGSQNGFDNGGLCGVCKWHKNPEDVEFALHVLEQLTRRYRDHPSFWGIGVLNEPVSADIWERLDVPNRYPAVDPAEAEGSEAVPTEFLKEFYREAYQRIRSQSTDVTVVFHDGFRLNEWIGYFSEPDFANFVVDTHLYLMERTWSIGDADLSDYLAYIDERFDKTLSELSEHFPIMVGEWCLDTMSAKAATLSDAERRHYHRSLAEAQLKAWGHTIGWAYWSYKLLVEPSQYDAWDLGKCLELGYLPASLKESDPLPKLSVE